MLPLAGRRTIDGVNFKNIKENALAVLKLIKNKIQSGSTIEEADALRDFSLSFDSVKVSPDSGYDHYRRRSGFGMPDEQSMGQMYNIAQAKTATQASEAAEANQMFSYIATNIVQGSIVRFVVASFAINTPTAVDILMCERKVINAMFVAGLYVLAVVSDGASENVKTRETLCTSYPLYCPFFEQIPPSFRNKSVFPFSVCNW